MPLPLSRRRLLAAASCCWVPAWAQQQPALAVGTRVYLEGEVTGTAWADPVPRVELLHQPRPAAPTNLGGRRMQRHNHELELRALLTGELLVPGRAERWRVNLPPLARLGAWSMPRPQAGQKIGIVATVAQPVEGAAAASAQVVFLGTMGYPLLFDRD